MAMKPTHKTDLIITRVFDAPQEHVWKAWTYPKVFTQWWGPKNFTTPVIEADLRVGGKYLYCMRSPDGKDYWGTGVYREILPMEKLVMTDSFADEQGNVVPASHYGMKGRWPKELLVAVTFTEKNGKTTMTLHHKGMPSGKMRDMTAAGWSESFDKLAALLATKKSLTGITAEAGKQEVVFTRIFDAPREVVFKAYTDPARIPEWWGPSRFTNTVIKMDVRPGGTWRIVQRDADGNEYAFHGVYHEVRSPEHLVGTFEFEGAPGHVSLETAEFAEHEGKTRFTGRSVFQSVEDRDAMLREGMEEGMIETMDRFAELLKRAAVERKAA